MADTATNPAVALSPPAAGILTPWQQTRHRLVRDKVAVAGALTVLALVLLAVAAEAVTAAEHLDERSHLLARLVAGRRYLGPQAVERCDRPLRVDLPELGGKRQRQLVEARVGVGREGCEVGAQSDAWWPITWLTVRQPGQAPT